MTRAEVKQLLAEILSEALVGTKGETLGFHSESEVQRKYVFVNRSKGDCLWYTFDNETKKHHPITHTKISGKIEGFQFRETEFKGKPDTKLVLTFDCGSQGLIALESSIKTVFSRHCLFIMSKMNPSAKDQRITLELTPGSEESVIFPTFYVNGQRQTVEFPSDFSSVDLTTSILEAEQTFNGSANDDTEDF